jgi:hypothetical protein
VLQATVQYDPRQPKLQDAAEVQARPVSSKAQYMDPPMVSQRVPVMHAALELQVRVQRWAPPCTMGRQTSVAAQSPSEVQRSSSCLFIVPPAVLAAEVDEELVVDVDDAADDDEGPAPELELDPLAPVPELPLDPLAPAPELPLGPAPPMPELPLGPAPPMPELDEAPPPPVPSTHCAFWLQE